MAASSAPLTTASIHAARSRAATSCLKKREETFVVFRRELISPDSTSVGQGNFFSPTTWGWALGLSAGRCGLKRVVPFESCGLLGKDLGHKEGLGDCIRVDVTTWL